MPKKVDIRGQRFGRLVALSPAPNKGAFTQWNCRCDCGNEIVTYTNGLRSGHAKSCGCLQPETAAKTNLIHGQGGTPTYFSWQAMIGRCTNPKHIAYPWYGARGITVCKRWRTFANFLADMGERPKGTTLDRKDNEKGYEPGNCRWATRIQQDANRRPLNQRRTA